MNEIEFVNLSFDSVVKGHKVFYDDISLLFSKLVRCVGTALFVPDPISRRLILRSFSNLPKSAFSKQTMDVPRELQSDAMKFLEFQDISALSGTCFDVSVLVANRVSKVAVISIPSRNDAVEGLLPRFETIVRVPNLALIYFFFDAQISSQQSILNLRELVSKLLVVSIHETERMFRKRIVLTTLRKRDLNSFLNSALDVARKLYPFEGGSIFLWDKQRNLLKLHATTGLIIPHNRSNVYYRRDEDRVTVDVAARGYTAVSDNIVRDHQKPGKYQESVSSLRTSFACIPITDYNRADTSFPLGVLRLINKVNIFDKRNLPVPFAWDDLATFRFVAEIMGVVTNYLRRSQEEQDSFERVIHGVKANIGAVALDLAHFEHRPNVITIHDDRLQYILSDCLAIVKDIKWQVERNVAWYRPRFETSTSNDRLQLGPVKITGEVLAKIKGLIPDMARAQNAGRVACDYADYEKLINLPTVLGNKDALMTVFRNLTENAVKYTDPDNGDSRIVFDCRMIPGFVEILVEDNGIGVPTLEDGWIFIDGYRGDNAMRRRPAGGSGVGLPQSKDLMEKMRGTLYYESVPTITRFVVRLRLFREDRP